MAEVNAVQSRARARRLPPEAQLDFRRALAMGLMEYFIGKDGECPNSTIKPRKKRNALDHEHYHLHLSPESGFQRLRRGRKLRPSIFVPTVLHVELRPGAIAHVLRVFPCAICALLPTSMSIAIKFRKPLVSGVDFLHLFHL